jgi:hypothetical protein
MAKVKTDKKKVEFNIKQRVRVELTPLGYDHLAQIHNSYLGKIPRWDKRDWKYYEAQADKEGYTEFILCDFMHTFGELTSLSKPPYFYPSIIIYLDS